MSHENYMKRAIELSLGNVNQVSGGPFGCVIVQNGKIIAEGVNEVTKLSDPTAHAEIQAIRKACSHIGSFNLTKATLYTSCEPCPMCLSAIYWARIPEVYFCNTKETATQYGFDDSFIYDEIAVSFNDRKIKMIQMDVQNAKSAFEQWDTSSDKIIY
jgi:guanine deaminase